MKKLNETMDGTFILPNAESYSNAILAFAKCPNGALLQEMVEQYNAGALVQSEPELILPLMGLFQRGLAWDEPIRPKASCGSWIPLRNGVSRSCRIC